MRIFLLLFVTLFICALFSTTAASVSICPYGCKYAGFLCCEPGTGLFNHYARYDSADGRGECWATCGAKANMVLVKEELPDFTIEGIELQGTKGYKYLVSRLKNQGKGIFSNKKNEDNKIKIEQTLQEYPDRGKAKQRKSIGYYRVKHYGMWKSEEQKLTSSIGLIGFELIPEQTYFYTIKINEFGSIPETNTVNNMFKAKVRATKEGSLVIGII